MFDTILTENPIKKPTIFTSIQTTRHQSLKKFHNQLKKDAKFCHHQKNIFQESAIYYEKCLNTVDKKLNYNINKQKKSKQKEEKT